MSTIGVAPSETGFADANGVRIYYEVVGSGYPLIFVHEFGGDSRSWETQMRCFSRQYRCIRFNARGYPPSDVPSDDASYGQTFAADDIAAVLKHLNISKAHVVGLSMGAFATLHFGLRHPNMASALVLAGIGSGAPPALRDAFAAQSLVTAERFEKHGSAVVAPEMGVAGTRVQLQNKDPLGWAEFVADLAQHSAKGSALTLRNYQSKRPSLYGLQQELAAVKIPSLLVVGDEDEPCLDANLYLKRVMPYAQLWMLPGTGHAVNLEEPAAFNAGVEQFLSVVDKGAWRPRDPRSVVGGGSFPKA